MSIKKFICQDCGCIYELDISFCKNCAGRLKLTWDFSEEKKEEEIEDKTDKEILEEKFEFMSKDDTNEFTPSEENDDTIYNRKFADPDVEDYAGDEDFGTYDSIYDTEIFKYSNSIIKLDKNCNLIYQGHPLSVYMNLSLLNDLINYKWSK